MRIFPPGRKHLEASEKNRRTIRHVVKYVRKDDCAERPIVRTEVAAHQLRVELSDTWEDFRCYEPFNIKIAVARTRTKFQYVACPWWKFRDKHAIPFPHKWP